VSDEQNPDDDDKFRPEAIAARVDQIGEETDADRVAREEEQKLLLRRKQQKKTGLQSAASRRLNRIGESVVKRPSPVGPAAQPDPLLDRVTRANRWIRGHRTTFVTLVAVGAVGTGGLVGWTYWQNKRNADASVLLALAFADEHGHLAAKDADDDDDGTARQLYPTFKSNGDRRAAAMAKYRKVESKYAGTGAAILARLGEASLLLDASDAKAAVAAYGDVRSSPLAQVDFEVRGRALEGLGFADELLAQTDAASKDAHLNAALAAFKELEGVDALGFKELAMYHQARVLVAQWDNPKAIDILKDLEKRVSGSGDRQAFTYLQFVVEDRLRELDPSALPPKAPKMPAIPNMGGRGGAGGNVDMSDPKIQEILRQLQEKSHGAESPAPPPGSPQ
jgi:hypothetical protein